MFNRKIFGIFDLQVALRRQQTTQDSKNSIDTNKSPSWESLLAQKRAYQKHLRSLQQSSLNKDILQGMFNVDGFSLCIVHLFRIRKLYVEKSKIGCINTFTFS